MDDNTKDGIVKTPEEDIQNQEQSTVTATTEEVVAEAVTTGTALCSSKAVRVFSEYKGSKAGRLWSETLYCHNSCGDHKRG